MGTAGPRPALVALKVPERLALRARRRAPPLARRARKRRVQLEHQWHAFCRRGLKAYFYLGTQYTHSKPQPSIFVLCVPEAGVHCHVLLASVTSLFLRVRALPHAGRAHARVHRVPAFAHVFTHLFKLWPAAHTDACARAARANITAGHMHVSVYSALKRVTAVVSHLALGAVPVPHRRSATHSSRLMPRVVGGNPRSFRPQRVRIRSGS